MNEANKKKHISEKHFYAICFITVDVVFASRSIERALANPFDAIFANTQRALACDKEKHASIGYKQFDIEFMCVYFSSAHQIDLIAFIYFNIQFYYFIIKQTTDKPMKMPSTPLIY